MSEARFDVYEHVTNQIISAMEAGLTGRWQMPWVAKTGGRLAANVVSKKPYRGVNTLLLSLASGAKGYDLPYWGTYKQWAERGTPVCKGEKATTVIFWKSFAVTNTADDGTEEDGTALVARAYSVFNAAQTDGGRDLIPDTTVTTPKGDAAIDEAAEAVIRRLGPNVKFGANQAAYYPALDLIKMPDRKAFIPTGEATATENYYSTYFHEITHWTKTPNRLNRDFGKKRWGDEGYAMEELVAEISACFVTAKLGIQPVTRTDHAEYIANWLKILRNDKRAIFTAASKAQQAADFILGTNASDKE